MQTFNLIMEDDKKLKEIFKLMFEKLKSISIGDNFIKEIDLRRAAEFDKNKSDSFFYEKLVITIHVGGFRVATLRNRWDDVKKAFSNYDVNEVSKYTEKDFKRMMNNPKLIRNVRKIRACIANAKTLRNLSKEYGSFGEYLDQRKNDFDGLKTVLKKEFDYLGNILALNYLKDIGIDSLKPDVHVLRVMFRLGLIDSESMASKNVDRVMVIAKMMSKATGERLNVIDAIFWIYGGSGDNHIQKAVCSKNNPLCNECPLHRYCIAYKTKIIR